MNTLISINRIYYLIGIIVMMLTVMTLRDKGNSKRFTTALFWFLFGAVFLFGDLLVENLGKSMAHRIIGGTVIIISLIAGTGLLSMGSYATSTHEERVTSSKRLGNWLFFPAVLIPVITVACTVLLKGVSVGGLMLLDQKQLTLAALCVACVCALIAGCVLTRGTPLQAVREGLAALDVWSPESVSAALHAVAEALGLGMGKIAQPLRVAITGSQVSPDISHTVYLAGQGEAVARIAAQEYVAVGLRGYGMCQMCGASRSTIFLKMRRVGCINF